MNLLEYKSVYTDNITGYSYLVNVNFRHYFLYYFPMKEMELTF